MDLAAAGLIIEKHDWLVAVLAASISPHEGCAGGLLVLFFQDLDRRLIAMNERLRSQPQFQSLIDAVQMLLARADDPVSKCATADGNAGPLECLRHAVERCAVDVFVDECEGQRRSGSDAARQGLRWHRCDYHRRVDPGTIAVAASVLEPHILQNLCLDLDMELLGNSLAHAVHLAFATRASFLIVSKVVFDTLAGQVFWQRSAAPLLPAGAIDCWQACIREIGDVVAHNSRSSSSAASSASLKRRSMCFFAARCKPMQPCQRQFFFQLDDPSRKRFLLGFQRSDFGSVCCQLRHQFCNAWFAGPSHQILESEPPPRVNSSIRHLQPAI